ncbi:MAG: hypothetical protein HYU64_10225 [Armatimonadetes bacterium]|nr:hypothetical protein [Armatimonadota bacterium]
MNSTVSPLRPLPSIIAADASSRTESAPSEKPVPAPERTYTRADRVDSAVKHFGKEAAKAVQSMTLAWMGLLVGATVGGAFVNGPLGIGMTIAHKMLGFLIPSMVGAIGGILVEQPKGADTHGLALLPVGAGLAAGARAEKTPLQKAATAGEAVLKGLRAIPSFIYPTTSNFSPAEREVVIKTLDRLPLGEVTTVQKIIGSPNLHKEWASGLARPQFVERIIEIDKSSLADPIYGEGVVIHEVGHTKDLATGIGRFFTISSRSPWGKGPYVLDPDTDAPGDIYAATNHYEDFAQGHKLYHTDPEALKTGNPAKYESMRRSEIPGLLESWMDRPLVRQAGKDVAALTEKVPGSRTLMDFAGSVIGPLTIHHAAHELENGLNDGDALQEIHGGLGLVSGTLFSFKPLAPAGLALEGIRYIVGKKLESGRLSPSRARNAAGKAMAIISGPVGLLSYGAVRNLKEPEKGDRAKGEVTRDLALTRGDKIYLAKTTGASILGGLGGTVAGGLLGEQAGLVLASAAGNPLAGAVLFIGSRLAGALAGAYGGSRLGGAVGKALA